MASNTDALYFQAHGLDVRSPETLNRALEEALARQSLSLPERPSDMMSEAELQAFREIGVDVDDAGEGPDPVQSGVVELATVIASGLTTRQAAERLGVSRSRISQRLADRELFAFRVDSRLVIPSFQFQGDGLVPGISQVNRALPPTRHPLTVVRWFNTPQPELEVDDGRPLTPLEWLSQGGDPSVVCGLAELLHEHP